MLAMAPPIRPSNAGLRLSTWETSKLAMMTEDLLISAIPGKEKWREGRIEGGRGEQRSNEEEEEKWGRKEKERNQIKDAMKTLISTHCYRKVF